jgi:predicted PhzF superfamily epimerase YddE/YHI9
MNRPLPYYHVDAFTRRLFAGNPAGVCLLEEWLSDSLLQAIAAEHNLAETAFLVADGPDFALRWFTPTREVDLCGHATLASAHVLFAHRAYEKPTINFQTKSGRLSVTREEGQLILDFPSRPPFPCEIPPSLLTGLGRPPMEVLRARDYFAVYASEKEIAELQPDFAALASLDALGIIVTAPGRECDFVSRFFAPQAGIPEDPVTGSAHCTLIPFWSEKLGKNPLQARQISRRGGELWCHLVKDRVKIGGHAITYSQGLIQL